MFRKYRYWIYNCTIKLIRKCCTWLMCLSIRGIKKNLIMIRKYISRYIINYLHVYRVFPAWNSTYRDYPNAPSQTLPSYLLNHPVLLAIYSPILPKTYSATDAPKPKTSGFVWYAVEWAAVDTPKTQMPLSTS